jgi:hypothetical protein
MQGKELKSKLGYGRMSLFWFAFKRHLLFSFLCQNMPRQITFCSFHHIKAKKAKSLPPILKTFKISNMIQQFLGG